MRSRLFLRSLAALTLVVSLPLVARAQTAGVAWRSNFDAAKLEAAQSGRLLLLHFTTKTCGPCRLLDKQVFSQPQVGQAVEQDYVPVRIDADASPALARMYRVERVPTEIIATPDGNPVFNPQIPNAPEPYVAQLQNMARHYRQTAPAGPPTSSAVNAAYADLPTRQSSTANPFVAGAMSPLQQSGNSSPVQPTPQPAAASVVQQPAPHAQENPYAAVSPPHAGQAQSVYATTPPQPAAQPSQSALPPMAPQMTAHSPGPSAPQLASNAQALPPQDAAESGLASSVAVGAPAQVASPAAAIQGDVPAAGAAGSVTGSLASAAAMPATSSGAASNPSPAVAVAGEAASSSSIAATPQNSPAASAKLQLPADGPPLGFEGYCPVTLKTLKKWTPGDAQYGVVHRGRTYLFLGAEQRDQFLADPDAYSPVFAGMDPVLLIDRQESVEGSRKFGYEYGGAFYLFSSKETMQKFASAPQAYAAGVRQAMSRIDSGNGTIRR